MDVVVLLSREGIIRRESSHQRVLILLQNKHVKMTGDSSSIDYSSMPLDFVNLTKEDHELLTAAVMSLGLAPSEPRLQVIFEH